MSNPDGKGSSSPGHSGSGNMPEFSGKQDRQDGQSRSRGLDLHHTDNSFYHDFPSPPFYNRFPGPPRNMEEMSNLVYSLKEDLSAMKSKHRREMSARARRRSSSYSRSRSRERGRFRSRSRSPSRDRRHGRHRYRSKRSRSRSRTRSPSRYSRRSSKSSRRSWSRASSRKSRKRSHSPVRKRAVSHPISSSDESIPSEKEQDSSKPDLNKDVDTTEQPADDPNNPFCGFVKQIAADTKVGDPINVWLAQFIEKSMGSPPQKDVIQEIGEKYKRPENVNNLQVPAVENAVWIAISSKARNKDNLRQKHQETFIKLMIALASATDELNKKYMAAQESGSGKLDWMMGPIEKLKDAIVIGSFHNMQDIIKRRRYDLEYYMPEKYRRLCTDFTAFPPTPTALLGENIDDAVKQMDITNKLTQKLDKNSKVNNTGQKNNNQSNNHSFNTHKKGKGFKNKKPPKHNKNDNRPYDHNSSQRPQERGRKQESDFRSGGPPKTN